MHENVVHATKGPLFPQISEFQNALVRTGKRVPLGVFQPVNGPLFKLMLLGLTFSRHGKKGELPRPLLQKIFIVALVAKTREIGDIDIVAFLEVRQLRKIFARVGVLTA